MDRATLAAVAADLGVDDAEAVEWMLEAMRQDRWLFHYLGRDSRRPLAIYARQEWPVPGYADILILHGHRPGEAVFYRTAMRDADGARLDVLYPAWVTIHYRACPRWTLRYMLTVDSPHPDDHTRAVPAPAYCGIEQADRRPVTIRSGGSHISLPPGWTANSASAINPIYEMAISG